MNWDEYFFRHVYLAASKSKDPRSQIGSVLVKDKIVISEGYNGFPRKVCDYPRRLDDRDLKLKFIVHAEANAILNCARNGTSTLNGLLYVNAFPCNECMKSIIQAGIDKIIVHKEYNDLFCSRANTNWADSHKISKVMAEEAKIEIIEHSLILNIDILMGGDIVRI